MIVVVVEKYSVRCVVYNRKTMYVWHTVQNTPYYQIMIITSTQHRLVCPSYRHTRRHAIHQFLLWLHVPLHIYPVIPSVRSSISKEDHSNLLSCMWFFFSLVRKPFKKKVLCRHLFCMDDSTRRVCSVRWGSLFFQNTSVHTWHQYFYWTKVVIFSTIVEV